MQKNILIAILGLMLFLSAIFNAFLAHKVAELEKQLPPARVQPALNPHQQALHQKFLERMAQDEQKYTKDQLHDAEQMYQVANKNFGSPQANASLQAMIQKYPDIDRTGCAVLYLAQKSKGDDRAKYLQQCIDQYNDCFYGDGVQVGALARYFLAQDCQSHGDTDKAKALFDEIKTSYPDAVDHGGDLLVNLIKAEGK